MIAEAPSSSLPAYHFPMLADAARNGAFDRALRAAIGRFKALHGGRGPRVLDIGSGSGLLAMMAARAGAQAFADRAQQLCGRRAGRGVVPGVLLVGVVVVLTVVGVLVGVPPCSRRTTRPS